MSDQQNTTPPAWYPDPDPANPGGERWWDGTRWSEHSRPAPTPAPEYHLPPQPAAAPSYGQYQAAAPAPSPYPIAPGFPPVPAGTSALTWSIWLYVGLPLLSAIAAMFIDFSSYLRAVLSISASGSTPDQANIAPFVPSVSAFIAEAAAVQLLGLVIYVLCVLFAYFDHRELARRGFARPFHWAWAFFEIVSPLGIVYVIGRTVVAHRRGGRHALWPIWGLIAVVVVSTVLILVKFSLVFASVGDLIGSASNLYS